MYRVYVHHLPEPGALARLTATYRQLCLEPGHPGDVDLMEGSYLSAATLAQARTIVEKLRTLLIGGEPPTCEVVRDGGFFSGNDLFADGSASPGRRPATGDPGE